MDFTLSWELSKYMDFLIDKQLKTINIHEKDAIIIKIQAIKILLNSKNDE